MDPLRLTKLNLPRWSAPADNTRVALPPVVKKTKPAPPQSPAQKKIAEALAKNPPRQHYISEAKPVPEHIRKARETQRRVQENLNKMYQSDPTAARINGMRNFGTWNKPQVQRVGPTVLEGAALLHPVGNFSLGTYNTVKQVAKTVKDPSAANIGLSALEVAGTASGGAGFVKGPLAGAKPIRFLAHNPVMHGAHKIHEGATVLKGLKSTSRISLSPSTEPLKLDAGPTLRNLEIKKQIGDSAWLKLWEK